MTGVGPGNEAVEGGGRRLLWWLVSLAAVVVVGALAWASGGSGPVLCVFRRVFDLPCPGCGMTRALGHLARGDLGAAVALHPLAPLVAAELAAGWGVLGLVAHGFSSGLDRRWVERGLAATALLLLAVWMGRLAIGDLSAIPVR